MENKYEPIPRFVPDTCKNCKGHSNFVLDCEYTDKEDRDLLVSVLKNYTNEKGIIE